MKYKTYPTMKDSGVEWIGEIPKHWKIAQLRFFGCRNFKKGFVNFKDKRFN